MTTSSSDKSSEEVFRDLFDELTCMSLRHIEALEKQIIHLQQDLDNVTNGDLEQISDTIREFRLWHRGKSHDLSVEYQRLATQFEQILVRARTFKYLYETGLAVSSELELERILDFAMEAAIEMTGAERGFLALVDEKEQPTFLVAKQTDLDSKIAHPEKEVSLELFKQVLATGEPLQLDDLSSISRCGKSEAAHGLRLCAVLAVPIKYNGDVLGVIYLDTKDSKKRFTAENLSLINEFARQIAVGVENAQKFKSLKDANTRLIQRLRKTHEFSRIIGKSAGLRNVLETIVQVADTQATVLIQGESGTGKELIAHAIHCNGSRRDKPFVVVNASAIPENLLESELFGYEPGAYTGATTSKPGKIEFANHGTVFLDEIGDMPLTLQAKILRAIQNREIEHLGGTRVLPIDVRILAATNKNLPRMIEEGSFREELYYRLNIVNIFLPPLRDRKEDIPVLANYFLKKYRQREKKNIDSISLQALEMMELYDWPGNVRELENVVERAVILCNVREISVVHLPREIIGANIPELVHHEQFSDAVDEFKKLLILSTLKKTDNNKAEAARRLGLNRTYFFKLLDRMGIR